MQRFMCRTLFHLTLIVAVNGRGRKGGDHLSMVLALYGRGRTRGNQLESPRWKTSEQSWKRFVKDDPVLAVQVVSALMLGQLDQDCLH
ncbi:hypothetical protein C5167_001799 [Papaver somniferum]|uniref:Secreted protein n=1 Tax=Papaver somniferum TaxID=3469 RepID=A0A4Y7KZ29_PAPSO|nr:hypothetical protein C5167_001799 [Papaver somniferum]